MSLKQPDNTNEKLFGLLEQAREETLSKADRAELNDLLRQDPDLVHDLIEYQERCAALRIMHLLGNEIPPEMSLFSTGDEASETTLVRSGSTWFDFGRFTKVAVSLLVLIVVALGIGYTLLQNPTLPVVARLVATDGCQWTLFEEQNVPQAGEPFRQGTMLKLKSGLAQIEYRSGVSILFQGPGRLELTEPNTVCLHSGVVISRVSPKAVGFTVNTPHSKVIDHGTEFAVGVDENRKTEVSVLEGKVELKQRQTHHDSDSRMLTTGQALRLDAKGEIELFRTIDPSRLAKNLTESDEVKRRNARVSIYRLQSANSLKLKGKLVRAINVGSDKGIKVGNLFFEPDDPFVLDSSRKINRDWGNLPWFGNSIEDKALCQVLHSIRHNIAEKGWHEELPNRSRPVSARLLVKPGRYRVQLLISENFHVQKEKFSDRSINLDIEGVPCLRDLRTLASQGIAGHPVPPNQALLIDVELDVTDNDLHISLFSNKVAEDIDPNVILNGLIIERLENAVNQSDH